MVDSIKATYKKILFCTDFSQNAEFAFHFALDAASRETDSELHLLHVIPESDAQFWKSYIYEVENVDEKAKHDIDNHIDQSYRKFVPQDQKFIVQFKVGNAVQEILNYAKAQEMDLIVIGRQGQSALGSTLFGKITEKICRHAECSVLVVPRTYQERFSV
jgi:nucleotide-binding universal stress UspA family protein